MTSVNGGWRCDDGSDDSIASSNFPEKSVLKGIERFEAIEPVNIQIIITWKEKPGTFKFSRKLQAPRLVSELSARLLALNKVYFLVADDEISCKDLLVGFSVLHSLSIDSHVHS